MGYVIADAHCDTLQKICDNGGGLYENPFQLDIKRLMGRKNGAVQVFAAFVDKKTDALPPYLRAKQLIDKYYDEVKTNSEFISHCVTAEEIKTALKEGKIAAMLSIEGGEAIEGTLEKLICFYNRGVRIMTLCWNYENEIADGIMEDRGAGLTDFGKKVVSEMNRLGMVIDVSHISEMGFWDVIERTTAPIAATHSNSKVIKAHPRNLDDTQIRAIIENKGFIGINLYNEFLSSGKSKISDVIRHIEHILNLGGEDCIGFGSDFDGMELLPDKIAGAEDEGKITEELSRLGYKEELIKKMASENFLKFIDAVIK